MVLLVTIGNITFGFINAEKCKIIIFSVKLACVSTRRLLNRIKCIGLQFYQSHHFNFIKELEFDVIVKTKLVQCCT